MALAIPVLIVVVLVFAYRITVPGPSIAALSDRPLEGDVLTVGALPVT
jgi:hypothetical protein